MIMEKPNSVKSPEELIEQLMNALKLSQTGDTDPLYPNETLLDVRNFERKHPIRTSTIVI